MKDIPYECLSLRCNGHLTHIRCPLQHCLVKKIECSYFLDYVVCSEKPLSEVKVFLSSCKAEGVNFHQLELPEPAPSLEWTLTFIRYGAKYVDYCGQIIASKKLFSRDNLGKVDWTSRRQRQYMLAVIMARYKTKDWQEICCVKAFMNCAGQVLSERIVCNPIPKEEKSHNPTMNEEVYKEFTSLHLAQKWNAVNSFF